MTFFLQQMLSGLATGFIYAGLALALSVVFEGTGVLNFAQGELAAFSALLAWTFLSIGMSFWLAFALTVVASFGMGVVIERVLIRPVEQAPHLTILIVTLALMLGVNALSGLFWGFMGKSVASPFGEGAVRLIGAAVTRPQIGIAGVILATLLVVGAFYRYTTLGLMIRAAAMNPLSSRYLGINVGWMLAIGWGIAAAVGAVAGIISAPITGVSPDTMSGTLLLAFAAFTLGGVGSRLGAVVGGLIVGLLTNLAITYIPFLQGDLANMVPFALIIAVLYLRPQGLFGRRLAVRS